MARTTKKRSANSPPASSSATMARTNKKRKTSGDKATASSSKKRKIFHDKAAVVHPHDDEIETPDKITAALHELDNELDDDDELIFDQQANKGEAVNVRNEGESSSSDNGQLRKRKKTGKSQTSKHNEDSQVQPPVLTQDPTVISANPVTNVGPKPSVQETPAAPSRLEIPKVAPMTPQERDMWKSIFGSHQFNDPKDYEVQVRMLREKQGWTPQQMINGINRCVYARLVEKANTKTHQRPTVVDLKRLREMTPSTYRQELEAINPVVFQAAGFFLHPVFGVIDGKFKNQMLAKTTRGSRAVYFKPKVFREVDEEKTDPDDIVPR